MIIPPAWPQVLDFFGIPLVIEPSPGQLSGDAGLLPVRQFDQRIGLTRAVVRLSSSWPHLDWYRRVCERLRDSLSTPIPHPSG
jgi:hypothetical protein